MVKNVTPGQKIILKLEEFSSPSSSFTKSIEFEFEFHDTPDKYGSFVLKMSGRVQGIKFGIF